MENAALDEKTGTEKKQKVVPPGTSANRLAANRMARKQKKKRAHKVAIRRSHTNG